MRMIDVDALAEAMGIKRLMIQSWEPNSAWGVPIVDAEPVVRCKNCKHKPIVPQWCESGFDIEFPDDICPCQCSDGWYSWCPDDNWFCGSGEPKEEN